MSAARVDTAGPACAGRGQRRRLLVLLAIGAVVTVLGGAYRYYFLHLPIGTGPAGPAVPRAAFEHTWSNRSVLLVGLGDSVTAGFGARRGYGYFDRLAATPADEWPDVAGLDLGRVLPALATRNLSMSATTSRECLADQLPQLEVQPPNVFGIVVVTTGGNDLIHNYGRAPAKEHAMFGATASDAAPWIAAFEVRLTAIVTGIAARFPGGCRVFLANIYDPTDGEGDIENAGLPAWKDGLAILAAYNAVIDRVAAAHAHVTRVDIRAAFLGHGIHCLQPWRASYRSDDPSYWDFSNLEDPNERGYDALRRLYLLEMARTLAELR